MIWWLDCIGHCRAGPDSWHGTPQMSDPQLSAYELSDRGPSNVCLLTAAFASRVGTVDQRHVEADGAHDRPSLIQLLLQYLALHRKVRAGPGPVSAAHEAGVGVWQVGHCSEEKKRPCRIPSMYDSYLPRSSRHVSGVPSPR